MAALMYANSASFFEDYYTPTNQSGVYREVFLSNFDENIESDFQKMVQNRYEYLDSLLLLRNDWISENSNAPNRYAIEFSKKILIDFSTWIQSSRSLIKPKLVMGPIPSGGVSFEFIVSRKFKIFLNIYNNQTEDMTIENIPEGFCTEIDTHENSIEYLLKKAYFYFSR
jgi:hypothetical protein